MARAVAIGWAGTWPEMARAEFPQPGRVAILYGTSLFL